MQTWLQFLIMCPMAFLAGLIDSIAGGGGLISLPMYLLVGVPPHIALGTNKLGSSMGTTAATIRFARNGFISLKKVIWYIPAALIGSTLGSNLTLLISERVVSFVMLVTLPVIAFAVLRDRDLGNDAHAGTIPEGQTFRIALAAAFGIGMYDGFYGPGTGTFLMLILTALAKMTLREATGTTKAINLSSNLAALVTFLVNGKVFLALGLAAGVCCIAGNYIGAGMVLDNGQKVVRPVVLVVLVLLFIKVISGLL